MSCSPSRLLQSGQPATCTATVHAKVPVSGSVAFSDFGSGSQFMPSSCQLVGGGTSATCAVTYIPGAPASGMTRPSFRVRATFGGTAALQGSHASVSIGLRHVLTHVTSVTCLPVVNGFTTECAVTVSDFKAYPASPAPAGTVHIALGGGVAGSCQLPGGPGPSASCHASAAVPRIWFPPNREYLDLGFGKTQYLGDATHTPSTTEAHGHIRLGSVRVYALGPTTTSVACDQTSLPIGQSTTCTVTVSNDGVLPDPAGSVTFSAGQAQHNPFDTFSPPSCTLSDNGDGTATCSTAFTPSGGPAGTRSIKAVFDGGSYDRASQDSTAITITASHAATTSGRSTIASDSA